MNYMRSAIKYDTLKINTSNSLTGTSAGVQSSAVMPLAAPINLSQYTLEPTPLELPQFSATANVVGTAVLMGRVNGSWVPLISSAFNFTGVGNMGVLSGVNSVPTTGILDALQNVLTITSASGGGSLTVNWANFLVFSMGHQDSIQTAA